VERRLKELRRPIRAMQWPRETEAKVAETTHEARDIAAKAKRSKDAVYDLKAVNPHRKPDIDNVHPKNCWTSSRQGPGGCRGLGVAAIEMMMK